MSETDIQNVKTQLVALRSSILNKTAEFKADQADSGSFQRADEVESASSEVEANVSFHLHERDRASLLKIDRALSKITNGTYGECESCGEHISAKRLAARPFADLCIDCQEDNESKSGHSLN